MKNDPNYAQVIKFVTTDQQLIQQVGPITSAKMVKITSVQSGIGVDDKFTPGFDLYRVSIKGERASAYVTVERKAEQDPTHSNLKIRSID